jgi:outer membrane protein assembly factor BamB
MLAGVPLAAPAAAASSQDWPTYLQNAGRTAATTDGSLSVAGAPGLKLDWSYTAGGPIATSASVVGTTAYVGAWDGYEYAISTTTGALIWKAGTGVTTDANCNPATLGITSAAAVVNGVVYVGGGGPYFYALDAGTGAVLWQAYTGDNSAAGAHYNWSSPLVVGNYAYVGIASNCDNPLVQGQLLQIAISGAQQGQVVNTYNFVPSGQVGGGIWTSPSYDAATNTIFVSTGTLAGYTQTQSQAIVALSATDLSYIGSWQLPFGASVSDSDWGTTPTLTTDAAGDQLLSLANKNGILYTFNRNNLAAGPVWQRPIAIGGNCPTCGDGSIASGIFANGTLYYAGGHSVVNGHGAGGSISALDPGTGNALWSRQTDSPVLGSPAYVSGMIGLVEGSTFEAVNAANGQLLFSYVLPSAVYGAVSVAAGQFYVGTVGGVLYAFGQGSAITPPADPNCPAGYTCQDIHGPAKGSEASAGGTLTVTAAGSDVKGTGDQFRFISAPVTGDSQVSARLVAQAPPAGLTAQAGLMVRQSNAIASPFYAILDYPNDSPPDLKVMYRSAWSKNPVTLASVPASMPVSLIISRSGNLFSAGLSADGVNFQLIPGTTASVDLPATTMAGIAVASGSSSVTGTATFTSLSAGPPGVSLAPPAPADPCPAGWSCADLGNPAPAGDTTTSGGALTLAGTGTGFGGASDSAHFVYQQVSGNASVSAQVTTSAGASGKTQDGLMMRASAAPTAPMYSVYLNPGGSATVKWRVNDGIAYNHTVPLPSAASPAWLQVIRWQDGNASPPGTYFTTLTSSDGVNWTPVLGSSVAVDLGQGGYLAGVVATSGTAGATTTAAFAGAGVAAVTSPPATACPAGLTCADIGGPGVPAGNQLVTSGNWTLQASGDIWSVYDEFRYAYQPFPASGNANGDGVVSAQVGSQAGGGPWMRSGVMIRSGTDPQAPYYGVFATPGNGVAVQWRPSPAAQTRQLVGPATAAPVYVEASRYTDTAHGVVDYSAYSSPDGVNWTLVPGSTVALSLPGPLVAGLASDANSSTNLTTATFSAFTQGPPAIPPNVCPSGWTCTDIGGALPAGTDSYSGGTWTETGGGGDIWGGADSFHLAYQPLAADGTLSAHVTAQQNTSPWAKAGVMLRASTDPGSPYYAAFVTPANGIAVQWRSAQGGGTSQLATSGALPAYLMIGRYTSGSQVYYTAYTSGDGATWTAIPSSTQALSLGTGPLLAGIAITSHNQGTPSAVTLDTVSVTATELSPPGACPSGWSCADIGMVTPGPGSQTLSGPAWSVTGFGSDIWGTADSFHYAYRPLAADGSISAQVTSQTSSSAWAKGGLMLRASTDPAAPYYAIFATPGNGVAVQWRAAAGGNTSQATTAGTLPVYVEVTRSGATYSAYTSPDGSTWTLVPGSSVTLANLSGGLLEGLAVTSHNTGQYSTVTYSSLVTSP